MNDLYNNNIGNGPKIDEHKWANGINCMSWPAILIGALFAVGLSFLMNTFSAAAGLSAFHLSPEGIKTLAIGGFFSLLIGTVAVMFFSGWIAGYLGHSNSLGGCRGGIYGFSAWAVALIITIFLSAHVGKFVVSFSEFIQTASYSHVAMTTNNAAPMVVVNASTPNQAAIDSEKAATGAFAVFILFFAGALSSAIGGHCGLKGCCKKGSCHHDHINQ